MDRKEIVEFLKETQRNRARCKWALGGELSGIVYCRYYVGKRERRCLLDGCPVIREIENDLK